MATYVGADWAGHGWFGVVFDDAGNWWADLYPSILSLWKYHSDASRILVDVPIGLPTPEIGRRRCDVRAKEVLGERHSSVFYAPVRDAVYEANLERARAVNEPAGFSIQNQAWSFVPRIREVDEFLDRYPSATDRLRETHPEVCFRMLHGDTLPSKHTDAGVDERIAVLADEAPAAIEIYEELVDTYTSPAYAPTVGRRHDILDALVAAVTARRAASKLATLPPSPPTDDRGLPMEIVYPSPAVQTTLPGIA